MIPQAKTLYAEILRIHGELTTRLKELETLTDGTIDLAELADTAYVCREANELNHDTGVGIRRVGEIAAKRACLRWVQISPDGAKIQTAYCTASPNMLLSVSPPKNDTPEFAAMMADMGIAEEVWKPVDTGERVKAPPLKFDYKGLGEYLTERQARGMPLPAGVNPVKTYNEFVLSIRKKKSIIDEEKKPEGVF